MLAGAGVTLRSIVMFPVRRRLSKTEIQIALRNGVSIRAPSMEPLLEIFREVWVDRRYMPVGFRVPRGHAIIDIGAHVGTFTLCAAAENPEARVIALEPSALVCEFLRRNVAAAGKTNVTILECACGGRSGEAMLYGRGVEAMNSLYDVDSYGSSFCALTRVPVISLDDLFERLEVRNCGLLKLDCEGAEYDILLSASRSTLLKVTSISMEYHVGLNSHTPGELAGTLNSVGFRVECGPLLDDEAGFLYARRID